MEVFAGLGILLLLVGGIVVFNTLVDRGVDAAITGVRRVVQGDQVQFTDELKSRHLEVQSPIPPRQFLVELAALADLPREPPLTIGRPYLLDDGLSDNHLVFAVGNRISNACIFSVIFEDDADESRGLAGVVEYRVVNGVATSIKTIQHLEALVTSVAERHGGGVSVVAEAQGPSLRGMEARSPIPGPPPGGLFSGMGVSPVQASTGEQSTHHSIASSQGNSKDTNDPASRRPLSCAGCGTAFDQGDVFCTTCGHRRAEVHA